MHVLENGGIIKDIGGPRCIAAPVLFLFACMQHFLSIHRTTLLRLLAVGLFLCATPASALTVSGTLYSDEGNTTIASGKTIKIAVSTSTPATVYTTTTDGSSNYSFTFSSLTATASLVVWVDATTSIRAVTYTRASSTSNNITALPLYQNRVIISHEGATTTTSVTNSDLAFYDATNDSDIQYDASSTLGTLLVSTGSELHVMTGKQFAPLGNVTIHGNGSASTTDGALHLPANSIFVGPATTTIAGNFSASSSASIYNFGVLHFTATTTGKSINATIPLGNLVFSNTQSISFATNATTTDILVNSGATVVAPPQFTITGDYTNNGTWTAGATTTFGNGGSGWVTSTVSLYSFDTAVYGNGTFFALGYGIGAYSTDGYNWSTTSNVVQGAWREAAFGNGTFVAVGQGAAMSSSDGMNWTERTIPELNDWRSVTYGNDLFVAVSDFGTNQVMTSPDGITWTARDAAEANIWQSVTYGNGLFVAVANSGTNRVMTSPDGITWTLRTSPSASDWRSVTYGNGLFVAVADVGTNRVMTSPDGITWTSQTPPGRGTWKSVTYGNGFFVAVASAGFGDHAVVMVSTDGVHWNLRSAPENFWYSVVYGNGRFLATSVSSEIQFMTALASTFMSIGDHVQTATGNMTSSSAWNTVISTGTTTHATQFNSTTTLNNLIIQSGIFVEPKDLTITNLYQNNATFQKTTPWSLQTTPVDANWSSVAYGNGTFVAVASWSTGARVMTSPDGITWTARTAAEANSWESVAYGNGLFVAVANSGTHRVQTSPDGITWTYQNATEQNDWRSVTYGNGLFVAVAQWGSDRVMTSTDGITWAARAIQGDVPLRSVAYGNNLFVAVGFNGEVMTSQNGVTWVDRTSTLPFVMQTRLTIAFGDGIFMAVSDSSGYSGATGRMAEIGAMTSPDGIHWTPRSVPDGNWWESVVYGGGVFTSVGVWGVKQSMTTFVGTTTFSGTSPQSITGTLSGNSSFGYLAFTGAGTKTFGSNASSTNFQIGSGATVVAPTALSIGGHYGNSGTFTSNSGTVFLTGYATQTLSGTMTGSSAFSNLTIMNTSGAGSSTQSINFTASASTTGTFTMLASTSARFLASATSTFQNIALKGSLYKPVWLRSSTVGTRFGWAVPGTQSQVTYVDVRDSSSCPTTITVTNGTNSGNMNCWSFQTLPSISGIAYTDEGTIPFEDGSIKVAVGSTTVGTFSATSDVFGFWDIIVDAGHAFATGTKLLTWIDNTASTTGALFTKASSTANVFTLSLYQNRLLLGRQYATTTTNSDLAFYDTDDDSDIPFTSNSGTLQVAAGNELHVGANVTFAPGGAVTIHGNGASSTQSTDGSFHLDIGSTYTAAATTTIAGSFTASTSVTFTPGNYTLLFNATTTEKTIDTQFTTSFGTTTFDGVGGGWTFVQSNATTSNLTVTTGFVDMPPGILSVTGNYVASGTVNHFGGKSWTLGSIDNFSWDSVVYGDGIFVAVHGNGDEVSTSSDGITWTTFDSGTGVFGWSAISYGNGTFVAVQTNGTDEVMTSPDGTTWTLGAAATSTYFYSVTFIRGLFVAVGLDTIMTSPDGLTWTLCDTPANDHQWISVAYGSGLFVAIDNSGNTLTSPDGVIWTLRILPDGAWPYSITYANDRFVAVGDGNAMTSPDGITWTVISGIPYVYWVTVVYGDGIFVALSTYFDQVMTSPDGINWTYHTGHNAYWKSVAFGNHTFVGVGWGVNGMVMASPSFATTTFSGSSQTITGTNIGNSAFGNVALAGTGVKTFAANASTSALTVNSGVTMVAPTALSIAGDYTNSGTFTANSGTVTLSGEALQTATGTMSGGSSFHHLILTNSSATTTFGALFTATGNFVADTPGVQIAFFANATSTVGNLSITGSTGNEVHLISSISGTHWNLEVTGTSTVNHALVQDSWACGAAGNILAYNSTDLGNTLCWSFTVGGTPSLSLTAFHWRLDDNAESPATLLGAENSTSTDQRWKGDRTRLRVAIANTGSGSATNYRYRLQYASSSCSVWTDVPSATSTLPTEWKMDYSGWMGEGALTTDLAILTNPPGKSFVSGEFRSESNQTGALTLSDSQFTELEFSVVSTLLAQSNLPYCFRFSDQSDVTNFIVVVRPTILLTGRLRPQHGGASLEGVGSGPVVTGGDESGGGGLEGTGSGGSHGGGGSGGGGGLE